MEEARGPGRNPWTHTENMQNPHNRRFHTEKPSGWGVGGANPECSCCAAITFHSLFIQIKLLLRVRGQLPFPGLSSEVQPVPSERSGPEWEHAAGFRSEDPLFWTGESKL